MADTRTLLAQAYKAYKARETITAKSLVRQALKLNPNDAHAWYMVGLLSSGDTRRQAFEKALTLDPQHKYARAALDMINTPSPAPFVDPMSESTPLPPPSSASVSDAMTGSGPYVPYAPP